MNEPDTLLTIGLIFLLAGTVKGIIGLGLPTVSIGLLAIFFELPIAMALLLFPSMVTNAWQAAVGGKALYLLKRFWPFYLMAVGTIAIGGYAIAYINLDILVGLLGLVLIFYAAAGLAGKRLSVPRGQEGRLGLLLGTINGILTGLTGSFAVPGVLYLQSVGLARDVLIQAMGILFLVSTLGLGVALHWNRFLTVDIGIASLAALVPAMAGMLIGQGIRHHLSENIFKKVFNLSLLLLGIYLLILGASRVF